MAAVLIVNADDLGRSVDATDAILACWRAGRISSATAMVGMADSERAARLAREAGLPTGLHLNLVELFTDGGVAAHITAGQAALVDRYGRPGTRIAKLLYDPRLRRPVDVAIAEQLALFRKLYAQDPTHVDGHHHCHLVPNVLFSRALPRGTAVRRGFTFLDGERPLASRAARRVRNRLIATRYRTTDWFFDFCELHPACAGLHYEHKLGLAASGSVEVMTHPAVRDEYEILMGDEWGAVVARLRPASFAGLA